MPSEPSRIAQSLEDGSYFKEARAWYSSIYLSVLSERYFFIILTTIATLTGMIALLALIRLMPLNPREPFIYLAQNAYLEIPVVKPIKTYRKQDINDALRRFFLAEFVLRREGYSSSTLTQRLNFVRNHSSKEAYMRYARMMDMRNPSSPVQKLGIYVTRNPTVQQSGVVIQPEPNKPGYYKATVPFSVSLYGNADARVTNYLADVTFYYKDLIVAQTKDMEEDKPFEITPMRFIVTEYDSRQLR